MQTTTAQITDTADRLRNTDQILTGGNWALILDITPAPTSTRPARLAITVCDPNGSLADMNAGHLIHLDAGDTITYRPGTSMRLADATGRRPGGVDITPAQQVKALIAQLVSDGMRRMDAHREANYRIAGQLSNAWRTAHEATNHEATTAQRTHWGATPWAAANVGLN